MTDGFTCGLQEAHKCCTTPRTSRWSKTDKLEAKKLYEAPAGWHWGSKADVAAIMGGGKAERRPQKGYTRTGRVGWPHLGRGGADLLRLQRHAAGRRLPERCTIMAKKDGSASTLPRLGWRTFSRPSNAWGSSAWPTEPARLSQAGSHRLGWQPPVLYDLMKTSCSFASTLSSGPLLDALQI